MAQTALLCGFLGQFRNTQKVMGDFRFPYGSPSTFAHIWLNKADCELFYFALKKPVSAAVKILLQSAFLCTLLFFFQKAESSVHCLRNSRLCGLELMAIYIQSIQHLKRSHNTNIPSNRLIKRFFNFCRIEPKLI